MKKIFSNKISTWTLTLPLRFTLWSMAMILIFASVYHFIANHIGQNPLLAQTVIQYTALALIAVNAIILLFKLPRTLISQKSFVAIHNAQSVIWSAIIIGAFYIFTHQMQNILINMTAFSPRAKTIFIATMLLSALAFLYTTGLTVSNLYIKYRRARTLNIPGWKIWLCMPFGFSALWIPGYFLSDSKSTKFDTEIKTKWYSTLTNWILSSRAHTIIAFIIVCIVSGIYVGLPGILLTFALASMFGIWVLQVGSKQFTKTINGKYANSVIILNWLIVICMVCFTLIPRPAPNVEININEVETIAITE